jgi:hypothetical protein
VSKLPWFSFYPKDWLTDVPLVSCSKEEKGVWIDLLCLMFLAPDRGVLADADGSPWPDEVIAGAIGGDISANLGAIRQLLAKGVACRNQRGAISNRRMMADERERQRTKERVRKYRGGDVTGDVTQMKRKCTNSVYVSNKSNTNTEEEEEFKPPTLQEVTEYCRHRQSNIDPQAFFAFYVNNGWKVGRAPGYSMRNWHWAVLSWEKNGYARATGT